VSDCTTKRCRECKEVKPVSEFNKLKRAADGLQDRCRSCFSEYNRQRYASNKERFKSDIYSYREQNPDKVLHSRMVTHSKNPTPRNAYRVVEAAISAGKVVRPDRCHGCGCSNQEHRIEAHHYDYAYPLEVTWLCTPCHRSIHIAISKRGKQIVVS
jgi:hypothetical protein